MAGGIHFLLPRTGSGEVGCRLVLNQTTRDQPKELMIMIAWWNGGPLGSSQMTSWLCHSTGLVMWLVYLAAELISLILCHG